MIDDRSRGNNEEKITNAYINIKKENGCVVQSSEVSSATICRKSDISLAGMIVIIVCPEAKTIVLLSWVYGWPRQLECQLEEKMGFIVRSWALELGLSWA